MNRKDAVPEFVRDALADVSSVGPDGRESPSLHQPELEAALVALAESIGTETPPPALKTRLMAAATAGPARFAPFFDDLAQLFDLGVDAVVRVLERAGSDSEWEPGPHPSIRVFHLDGGPALATADVGIVRMPASFEWGSHRHQALERVLILEGGYEDSTGRVYRPGDIHEMGPGTEHSFTSLPETPLVFALVLHGDIEMI